MSARSLGVVRWQRNCRRKSTALPSAAWSGSSGRGRKRRFVRCSRVRSFVLACVVEAGGGSDNLPTVIAEAMACGLPVVSTRVAGVPEMVSDGEDGLLAPPGDPARLAEAIGRLLRDPALAERLSVSGRRSAVEKFSIGNTTRELQHLMVRKGCAIPPDSARDFDPDLPCPTLLSRIKSYRPRFLSV